MPARDESRQPRCLVRLLPVLHLVKWISQSTWQIIPPREDGGANTTEATENRRDMPWLCLYVPLEISPRDLNTCRPIAYCQPVSGISGRRHLRSADRGHLDFPRVKLASYGGHSFAYAGPSNWNSLPAHLRDNSLSLSSFRRHLKTFLFSFYYASTRSAFGVLFFLQKTRYINSLLLLLLLSCCGLSRRRWLSEITESKVLTAYSPGPTCGNVDFINVTEFQLGCGIRLTRNSPNGFSLLMKRCFNNNIKKKNNFYSAVVS